MAPPKYDIPDAGGPGGPSSPDDVNVKTGDLESFAKELDALEEYWADDSGAPKQLVAYAGDEDFPRVGSFSAGSGFTKQAQTKMAEFVKSLQGLDTMLLDLAKAARGIREHYDSVEELNNAQVTVVTQEMSEANTPADGSPGTPGT